MKRLTCEMCGGMDIIKQGEYYVCQYCGTKYSPENAKKLLVEIEGPIEVKGTVKIDNKDKIKNLYQLARIDIDKDKFGNALQHYENILLEEPNSWEAQFFVDYIKCLTSPQGRIYNVATSFGNSLERILNMVNHFVEDIEDQKNALDIMCMRCDKAVTMLLAGAKNVYYLDASEDVGMPIRPDIADVLIARKQQRDIENEARRKCLLNCEATFAVLIRLGDGIESVFAENEGLRYYALKAWKALVKHLENFYYETGDVATQSKMNEYISKVKKYDASYCGSDLPVDISSQIQDALLANKMVRAIKIYQGYSQTSYADAMSYIERFASMNKIKIANKARRYAKNGGTETIMRCLAYLSLFPSFFYIGIFVPVFRRRAEEENGGCCSEKAKRYVRIGLFGFFFWALVLFIVIKLSV